ncbi:MAG: glycosyltransferase [Hungatella sp.]|nr:glycosyltransferase [Hungatella sp.]
MKLLEVNFSDLVGHIFNGYDLHIELIKRGVPARQLVLDKRSGSESVRCILKDSILHHQIREFERKHSISNLLYPYGEEIANSTEYDWSDLVHYHILHNGMVSLLDYPRLMNGKKSVWTVHDPWVVTGNCVYPLNCGRWKEGCGECARINEIYFEMDRDNTNFMWKQKRRIFSQINPHVIVSSGFMKRYLEESPITAHFSKVHTIPFGIDVQKYLPINKAEEKHKRGIDEEKTVIGFRVDNAAIKGNKFIFEALRKLDLGSRIELMCIGNGSVPLEVKNKYHTIELGWVNDETEVIKFYQTCDIFVMPSLAETFGLMAIEAMASECTVISFQSTVLEEITNAPDYGIAVKYSSSEAIAWEIARLINNPAEIRYRGEQGRKFVKTKYSFDVYIENHMKLFEKILEEP